MASPSVSISLDHDSVTAYPAEPALVVATATPVFSDGATLINYVFSWGDGSPVDTTVTTFRQHQYTVAGVYSISVTVTDSHGLQATASKLLRVYREALALPAEPNEIPLRLQHVPLDPRRPAFTVRRPSGTSTT
jgi:hypothetical protein